MKRLKMLALSAGCWLSAISSFGGPALAQSAPPDFQQVLQAPDDPQLNLSYARIQADAGNLLEAAAALERVLTVHPEWNSARLLYGVVLYRLDDLQGAWSQISQVNIDALPALQQAEARNYRSMIKQARDRFSVRGDLSIGAVYDSDATAALVVQLDSPFADPRRGGSAGVFGGDLEGDFKLTDGGTLSLYASASGVDMTTLSGPDHAFSRVEGQAGLAAVERTVSWRIGVVVRDYTVFNSQYLTEAGGRIEVRDRLDPADTLSGSVEFTSQTYDEPFFDLFTGVGGSHDGWHYSAAAGFEHRFSARSLIFGGVGLEDKEARYEPFAYVAEDLQARYDFFLGRGAYLDLGGTLRFVQYRQDDLIFLGGRRKDAQSEERIAIGAPLSAFTRAGATGDFRDNVILEAALNHIHRDTVFPLADYDSSGAELRLFWRFGAPR